MTVTVLHGNSLDVLATLPPNSMQCVVTSPPYWNLRDYSVEPTVWGGDPAHEHVWGDAVRSLRANGLPGPNGVRKNTRSRNVPKTAGSYCDCGAWLGCLGLEPTPWEYIDHLVLVFRAVRRVLRDDGTLWLNLGDTHATNASTSTRPRIAQGNGRGAFRIPRADALAARRTRPNMATWSGLKKKDLLGLPWRVAFALQDDGWYLRMDIVWSKTQPMPESVTDRPTRAHEFIFLLSKRPRYVYDADAIREAQTGNAHNRGKGTTPKSAKAGWQVKNNDSLAAATAQYTDVPGGRNARSVWTLGGEYHQGTDHYATYPRAIPRRCILAGTAPMACEHCGTAWRRVREPTGAVATRKPPMYQGRTTPRTAVRAGDPRPCRPTVGSLAVRARTTRARDAASCSIPSSAPARPSPSPMNWAATPSASISIPVTPQPPNVAWNVRNPHSTPFWTRPYDPITF
jgi:DNA modification methylase